MAQKARKPSYGHWLWDGDLGWVAALPSGFYKNKNGIVVHTIPEGYYKNSSGIVVAAPTEKSRREDRFRSRSKQQKTEQLRGRGR